MGYILRAFIGKKENINLIFEKYKQSQKIDLRQGFSMIPMTKELYDEINEKGNSSAISTFEFLTKNIEQKTIDIIENKELAYVESEFFGGQGGHIGIMWKSSKRELLTEFDKNSMNRILKKIGVKRTLLKDEFRKIGLDENRNTEDWLY